MQARDCRPVPRSRLPRKTMRQQSPRIHGKERPPTHFKSDPFRKQVGRHKLTPKRPELMTLKSHRRMQHLELWHTLHRLTMPLQCQTTTLRGLSVAASRPPMSSHRYSFSLSQSP